MWVAGAGTAGSHAGEPPASSQVWAGSGGARTAPPEHSLEPSKSGFCQYLGAAGLCKELHQAGDEAILASSVPATEAVAWLLEVVLLLNHAPLPGPADGHPVLWEALGMAHGIEARGKVVDLQARGR